MCIWLFLWRSLIQIFNNKIYIYFKVLFYLQFLGKFLCDFLILFAEIFIFLQKSFAELCCKNQVSFFLLQLTVDICCSIWKIFKKCLKDFQQWNNNRIYCL